MTAPVVPNVAASIAPKGHLKLLKQKYAHPTYPLIERKIKWDDYGEIIK